jgi:hypothetical protein
VIHTLKEAGIGHLNESQRALIAASLANMPKHLHKTDRQICLSQPEAAKMLNVSMKPSSGR